jgi:MFS family permease
MGIFFIGFFMGPLLAPVIGGFIANYLNWRATLWFLVLLGGAYFWSLTLTLASTIIILLALSNQPCDTGC